MKITAIQFNNVGFRNLKNLSIALSPRITIIAGHNGIGKSTILGLIANGSELKSHKTLLDKPFRAEFSEIFFLDYYGDFQDREEPNCATLVYHAENGEPIYKNCSVTGSQKVIINKKQYKSFMGKIEDSKLTDRQRADLASKEESNPGETFLYVPRMRVIPRTDKDNSSQIENFLVDNNIGDAAKLPIPTIYLGMSRINPIGEFEQHDITLKSKNISQNTANYIYKFFNQVIPNNKRSGESNITSHTFGSSKKASLLPEFKHSSLSISLGQDSLSSIVSAFASFFQLKEQLKDEYHGGILIIDEIEAGLHPRAQLLLIRTIQKQARDLNLQVIATTHSLTIIKEVLEAVEKQSKGGDILDSVVYLMDTKVPKVMDNLNYTKIKSDMLLIEINQEVEPLKVYFEDDEAKYFFEKILQFRNINDEFNFGKKLDLISLKIGCEILIKLAKSDTYFTTAVLVLDNDVITKQSNKNFLDEYENACALPESRQLASNVSGKKRTPEGLIYDFLLERLDNCEDHTDFWSNLGSYTTDFVEQNILNLSDADRNNREKMKSWFNDQKVFFEQASILEKWCQFNQEQVDSFIKDIEGAINKAVQNLELAKLKK